MRTRVSERVDGVPGTRLYEVVDASGTPIDGPLVGVVAVTHGNELVGIGVLDRLEKELPTNLAAGSVLAVHSNLRAWKEGVRHTDDGVDLNRLWDRTTLASLAQMPRESLCYEESRALELAPLLQRCDTLLDLHSTSRPSAPFLLYRDDQRHATMAQNLGVANMVTGLHESSILDGGLCSNIGLHPGEVTRRLGFTFEAGQHDDPGNQERAWQVAVRLLHQLGMWSGEVVPSDVKPHVYEVLDRFAQAPPGNKPWTFVDPRRASSRRTSPRQLESFEAVMADEMLVRRGTTCVRAHSPFTMLMPAPDAKPGADLFYYAQRRHGGLASGEYRTNAEARREATAIERMMDLLGDDEMAEGASWVSFDNRRCLDLCADLIGRALRLDEDDPHRKITVVGRGDWGGGETERRNGHRYRQIMRRAIASGVPIERLQVLRGASLGWLDALTSEGMLNLIQKREKEAGVRLLLSVQQPHTVSVLAVGDLEHALSTGDTRHCRVAILIEAATVEPDEDTARVRVVRTGVVGTRPEILRAAQNVIGALRTEHQHLVTQTRVFHDAELGPLVRPDGVLEARADPALIEALRYTILRLQLRLWCDALRPELEAPLHLPNGRAVGRWLASVMTRSGILDVDILRRLLIRPQGAGWTADLAPLEILLAEGSNAELEALVLLPAQPVSPKQPVLAQDVDADNLERWIGWKRYLRGLDAIPANRGKDIDLAFSERSIGRRITRWLRGATERAQRVPGATMVVMAGDGMNPHGSGGAHAAQLLDAHREVLRHPAVRYLRIQHAQGTHMAWMKDMVATLGERPDGEPVGMVFEGEHGATVNVIMVCARVGEPEPWSLDGWRIENCAVIVSDLDTSSKRDYKLALFTERMGERGGLNEELLHFGRAHCEGLLKQVGSRTRGDRGAPQSGALEQMYCRHLERWVEKVRSLALEGVLEAPDGSEARVGWVARQLGIADLQLARSLAEEMDGTSRPRDAALRLWKTAPIWPAKESGQPLG